MLEEKEKVRQILGYLPQEFGLYPKVSAETLLDHLAKLKGIANSSERKEIVKVLLHKTNLFLHRKKNLGGYSGGMKQRFGIAQALIGEPKLIIVDEPTAGLDPAERNRFHNLLSEISESVVVILSSHIVDDIQSLCSQMAIIDKGIVLVSGKPDQAIAGIKDKIWKKVVHKSELDSYKSVPIISQKLQGGMVEIHVYSDSNPESGFVSISPSLEDVYFASVMLNSKQE